MNYHPNAEDYLLTLPEEMETLAREIINRFFDVGPPYLRLGFGWGLPIMRGRKQIGYFNCPKPRTTLMFGFMYGKELQDDFGLLINHHLAQVRHLQFKPQLPINWQGVEALFLQACELDAAKAAE